MDPMVQFITRGVPDVETARRVSVEGLGWPAAVEVPGEITFIQVVDTEEKIAVLNVARTAGGTSPKPPQRAKFGGLHGYFADLAGFRWEIAPIRGGPTTPKER
jgi:hypothetical protein